MSNVGTGITIGIPTLYRPTNLPWALAFKSLTPPINFNSVFHVEPNRPVADARNIIAEGAVKNNHKYLFFLGDDVEVPNHTLRQLIFRMEHDDTLGVVGGVYCSKSTPPAPLVFRGNGAGSYWKWKIGEYFECTGLGMDCTLIRVEMLKDLPKPWFKTVDGDGFIDGVNHAEQWTEDLYFLEQVKKLNKWRICCDASVICRHWDAIGNKVYDLPADSYPVTGVLEVADKLNGQEKKIVDIGCGPIYNDFNGIKPIRVDIREDVNPDYRLDVRHLTPLENEDFDVVFSSHVLEHISRNEVESTLDEWIRILKPDGELRLVLPNIKWAAERIMNNEVDHHVMNVLYGAQSYPTDFHYNGFTPETIVAMLKSRGFIEINTAEEGYNLIVIASRVKHEEVKDGNSNKHNSKRRQQRKLGGQLRGNANGGITERVNGRHVELS